MSDRYFSSYKSLFKIKWKIYAIGDKQLIRPIPLDSLGIYILLYIPSVFISAPLTLFFDLDKKIIALVIDAILTWVVNKFDPQGRPFLVFIYDFTGFYFKKKRRDFSGYVPSARKLKVRWHTIDFE